MMDLILDGLGDILEPITDKYHLDDIKTFFKAKWLLYGVKILVACFMIGTAVINMVQNQSIYYISNVNGVWKLAINMVKLAFAIYMFDRFQSQITDTPPQDPSPPQKTTTRPEPQPFEGFYNMFKNPLHFC